MEKSLIQAVFDLGARLGSLEGYLYGENQVEKKYLAGWLQNIDNQFKGIPNEARDEISSEFREVLNKVAGLLQRRFGDKDPDTIKCKDMASKFIGG